MRSDDAPWSPPGPMKLIREREHMAFPGTICTEYEAGVYDIVAQPGDPEGHVLKVLQISRGDGLACSDWRDKQWIKNQIAGRQAFAVEVYPPEDRVNDPSNASYLWVLGRAFQQTMFQRAIKLDPEDPMSLAPQRAWAGPKE